MRSRYTSLHSSSSSASRGTGRSLAAILGFTLVFLLAEIALLHDANHFFEEGYGIERVTVALYVLAIALWFVLSPDQRSWQVPVILALMAMREMDFDKRFTEIGLLKSNYYLRDAPITDKLAGILLLVVIAVTGWRLLRHNLGPWLRALRDGRGDAWLVVGGILCAVISKSLDGLARKLEPFGVTISPQAAASFEKIEEILEMVLVICFCEAIARYGRRARG